MPYEKELQAALTCAREASQAILEIYERFEVIPNAHASISTEADHKAQEIILRHLHGLFPGDALCAEEQTPSLAGVAATGPRLWIVDPIDGTRGFARKNGEFSVMVAFVEEGSIALGVVQEPAKGRLTWAVRGQGCWRRDGAGEAVACRVSATDDLTQAILTQSHSRNPAVPNRYVQAIRPARVVETYSAGIKLALVARGEVDLYVNDYTSFHDWDLAAGHILVVEAGGTVTGLYGQKLEYGVVGAWQRHGVLATNGVLHDPALQCLQGTR
jgi:3'(2'), 5'-bisphosphate nucleotidase